MSNSDDEQSVRGRTIEPADVYPFPSMAIPSVGDAVQSGGQDDRSRLLRSRPRSRSWSRSRSRSAVADSRGWHRAGDAAPAAQSKAQSVSLVAARPRVQLLPKRPLRSPSIPSRERPSSRAVSPADEYVASSRDARSSAPWRRRRRRVGVESRGVAAGEAGHSLQDSRRRRRSDSRSSQ